MIPTDPLSILELLLVALVVWITIRHYQAPCANFPPGPWGLPIIGSALMASPTTPYRNWMNLSRKYGDVYSLKLNGEPVVIINGMKATREALVKKGTDFADRPKTWLLSLFNEHNLGIVDGHFTDEWQRQRKFAHTTLRGFGFGKTSMESKIMEEVVALVGEFKSLVGKSSDIGNIFDRSISNVICSIAFGERFQYGDTEFRHILHHLINWLSLVGKTIFVDALPPPLRLFFRKSTNEFVHSSEQVKQFCRDQIKKHRSTLDEDNIRDFIDAYLVEAANEKEMEVVFSDAQLEHVLLDLFAAGTETTSTTLSWTILFMMNHPKVQERVYQEITKVIGNDRLPTLADREKLPYTEATLLETLRLGSIAPFTIPHRTLVDTTLNGYNIPKGTLAHFNLWSIHNDAEVWPQPEKFSPERFYDHERNSVKKIDRIMPFSAGRRVCMGEQLAKHEMFLYFTTLIQRFQFSVPRGTKKPSEQGVLGLTLRPEPYQVLIINPGNVERNPGPPRLRSTETATKEDISDLHEKLDAILADTKTMNNNFALLQSRLDNVEEDLNDIKVQIQEDGERITELEKLKFEIDKMKVNSSVIADSEMQGDDSAGLLKSAVDDMRKSINEIKKEKDDLENRSRRNNLVFFGITQDRTNENWEDSEDKITQVIRNQLGIADNVEFERVHRMTTAPPVRDCKPIVARFRSFKDREKVLRNAFKLKNTNISVSEDFSRRVRRIRSKLWGHRRALLETNKDLKAHLQYDKLVVKGTNCKRVFSFNEETALIVWIIVRHYQAPCVNFPPGPWGLPIIGSALMASPKSPYKNWLNLSRKYGDVFSFKLNGEPIVVVNGMAATREALVKKGTDFADRPTSIVDGHFTDEWQRLRKFAHTTLRGFGFGKKSMESKIMEEVVELVNELKALADKPSDVENLLDRSISNIICSIAFGERFQYNDTDFHHILHHLSNWLSLVVRMFFVEALPAPLRLFFRKSTNIFSHSAERVKQFCRDQIKKHRATLDENNIRDFIDAYLVEAGNGNELKVEFSDAQLEHVLLDLFAAGTETTATTLKWAMLFMMNHPQEQEKVYQEIKQVIGMGRFPTLADREKLPYTEASLMETLRLGSTGRFTLPHRTLVDTTLNGYNIPKGILVHFNLWSIHNDATVWSQPEKFSPGRFYDIQRNSVKKTDSTLPFSAGIASGHFTDEWQRQRNFAHTTLKGFGFGKTSMESKIMEEVLEVADIFKARVGKSFDVENQFHRSISNIICSMAFGKRFQYNEATFRHLVHHQANFLSLAVRIVFLDGLPAPVQLFFRKSINDFVYSAEQIKKFCRDQINEHRETLDEHNIRDFIDAYLVEAGNENGVAEEFSDEQLEFVLFDLFGAGTDTIACALKWSILFMMNHPQAQEKVYQEIKKVIGNNRKPTLADRNKLPYTEASLLEIYRLGSVLPIGLPHRTLVDTTLNGYNIPKDTFVSFNLWSINNDAEVWPEPEKFSPERFYDHERNSVRNANSILPFSAGRRVCMGEQLAKHQMFLFLTTLIQRFKFSVPSGMKNPSERAVAGFSLYPEPYEMLISNRPC
ncbi:uncharacterized protein [Ptychodera flava]|uniref:uncharacterized protein n=1 Tax=Ptychodera flava TaxID=63121 RepID=UPI00396A2357